MNRADLHTHSIASDGTFAPADVVRRAHAAGVSALALTDHDTVDGLPEAAAAAEAVGIAFLPGIEVSCAHPRPGTVHLLGYGFEVVHPSMRRLTTALAHARLERAERIVAALRAGGIDLTLDQVREQAGGLGRPHFAAMLIRAGHAVSTRDAFDRFLGGGGSAYVENNPLSTGQVIPLIRDAGGFTSLAHPIQLRRATWPQLEAMIREMAEQGMDGLETLHNTHDLDMQHRLTRLADRLELIPTGGSDFHGSNKPWIKLGVAGGREIPRGFYDDVMEWLRCRRRAGSILAAA